MRPALLFHSSDDVVGRQEVRHQHAIECFHEEFIQGGMTPRWVEQVESGVVPSETPHPPTLPLDPPTGFVGMEHSRIKAMSMDLLVPRKQHVAQSMPHLHQAAVRERHLQMVTKNVDDL